MRPAAADAVELLERCHFPEAGQHVDLAVSGGPDSCGLALLAAAAGLTATIHHVEHGLRPGAAQEAPLVEGLAHRLGAAFVAHRVSVEQGGNLEARARAARRAALPAGVLTGHTMDDQAETVLLNVLRGAGLDGLAGMSTSTKPLLGIRRTELRAFVVSSEVEFATDASNYDLSLRRNLVRARLLPELNGVAGRDLVPMLARLASLVGDDARYLDELALDAIPDPRDVASLRRAPVALRRRRLRDLARRDDVDGSHPPSAAEVERMEAVVMGLVVATELAGGRRLARRDGRLAVEDG
ncbi:MAG TPA: tRNA lysidine(34) synthetase TilS [Acidimicrobiales bacterium]|jgi:tRNA(Ile)-lysidine synthase|nr:tRNA lysidine(34) synthetase TilS [Acidimicrobiales bacterium]